jgi:hypothetical protein
LIGRFEFVDRQKNSVVPRSNEFDTQAIEILFYFLTLGALLTPKNAIFAVFGFAWSGGPPPKAGVQGEG